MNHLLAQDVTDPTDFEEPKLAKLDASHRCPICKEFLDGPVSLNCGHSFCSLCVRGALSGKQECPSCREKAVEGHLKKNLALEEAVIAWKAARPIVLAATKPIEPEPERPSKKRKLSQPPSSSQFLAPPDTQRSLGKASQPIELESSPPPENLASGPDDMVECPACNKRVKLKQLNGHLDRNCKDTPTARLEPGSDLDSFFKPKHNAAASSSKSKAKKSAPVERKPIAKYSYDAMKLNQIKTALSTHGLWDNGTREAMVARLQHWVTLYNANLDRNESLRLSDSTLRTRLRQWEETRANLKGKAAVELPQDPKAYADAHADDFAELVAQAKASNAKNKAVTASANDAASSQAVSTQPASQTMHQDDSDETEVIIVD
ncbi:DNA repair protein rad18 [Auricularia subglabra TFB-10046 SS5]|nr:DNA repair protein rad18 [Auricularia subglabra TFB-10046 SS5]